MIVKILINGKEFGIDVSEDMGEVTIHDTFHCDADVDGSDTIFGTEDPMVTIKIKGDDIMNLQCNHGCDDCSHFDGGNCINAESNYYGCTGGIPAADCHVWSKEIKGDDDMINQAREIIRKYLNIEIIGYTSDPKNNIITFDLYDFLDKPGNFESDIKSAANEIKKLLPNHTVETKFYNDSYWNGEEMEDTYNCILGIIGGDL